MNDNSTGNPFLPAADLRAKLNSSASVTAQTQVFNLLNRINAAVEKDESRVKVATFAPGVQQLLEERGYTITFQEGEERYSTSCYWVTW